MHFEPPPHRAEGRPFPPKPRLSPVEPLCVVLDSRQSWYVTRIGSCRSPRGVIEECARAVGRSEGPVRGRRCWDQAHQAQDAGNAGAGGPCGGPGCRYRYEGACSSCVGACVGRIVWLTLDPGAKLVRPEWLLYKSILGLSHIACALSVVRTLPRMSQCVYVCVLLTEKRGTL